MTFENLKNMTTAVCWKELPDTWLKADVSSKEICQTFTSTQIIKKTKY